MDPEDTLPEEAELLAAARYVPPPMEPPPTPEKPHISERLHAAPLQSKRVAESVAPMQVDPKERARAAKMGASTVREQRDQMTGLATTLSCNISMVRFNERK